MFRPIGLFLQAKSYQIITDENAVFQDAAAIVRETGQHLFLTGKAGTGKTTFLRHIMQQAGKQMAVVAPTGVAAIHAGGETIHSFFGLPFGPFLPQSGGFRPETETVQDRNSLLKRLRLRKERIDIIKALDTLIIDEVSMVRADLLDAMDTVLRHVRRRPLEPFGGVQMIFIGDLFQLPPVVKQEEWILLHEFYSSPYFYDAVVLRDRPPVHLELEKVYRQSDRTFVHLLNRIRTGQTDYEDLELLNERYRPDFRPEEDEGYITLTTHNQTAETINREALAAIDEREYVFTGEVTDDFSEALLPTDLFLRLKAGAQVMFIKNDIRTPRRYYNGKIGRVEHVTDSSIRVSFPDGDGAPVEVEKEKWENKRYAFDEKQGSITETVLGTFTQYPLKLAWAITVHKSQGLTFHKVVIDLGKAFAPGQTYVALSRCVSLDGLVMRQPLQYRNILVDERVIAFANRQTSDEALEQAIAEGRRVQQQEALVRRFSLAGELEAVQQLWVEVAKKKSGPKEESRRVLQELTGLLETQQRHCLKFAEELRSLAGTGDADRLTQRVQAAVAYFATYMTEQVLPLLRRHTEVVRKHEKVLQQLKSWEAIDSRLVRWTDALRSSL